MWFAGEPVKYYYGGHLVTTLFAWLTATPPRFAYNLALAGFYATLVTAASDWPDASRANAASRDGWPTPRGVQFGTRGISRLRKGRYRLLPDGLAGQLPSGLATN